MNCIINIAPQAVFTTRTAEKKRKLSLRALFSARGGAADRSDVKLPGRKQMGVGEGLNEFIAGNDRLPDFFPVDLCHGFDSDGERFPVFSGAVSDVQRELILIRRDGGLSPERRIICRQLDRAVEAVLPDDVQFQLPGSFPGQIQH